MSLRSTSAWARTARAPSRRRVVMAPLKRLQTIATRTPRPVIAPSRCSPTRLRNSATRRGSSEVSSLDVIKAPEHVSQPLALGTQVVDIERGRAALERDTLDDLEP